MTHSDPSRSKIHNTQSSGALRSGSFYARRLFVFLNPGATPLTPTRARFFFSFASDPSTFSMEWGHTPVRPPNGPLGLLFPKALTFSLTPPFTLRRTEGVLNLSFSLFPSIAPFFCFFSFFFTMRLSETLGSERPALRVLLRMLTQVYAAP